MLVFGVLGGVVLAVVLSLFWLLAIAMRPKEAILGQLPGLRGFHSVADYPEAETRPGLLLYRFGGNLVFFNIDYFCERVRAAIRDARPPAAWVVVDLSPVSVVDVTAMQRFAELREELARRGVTLAVARARRQLLAGFERRWVEEERMEAALPSFPDDARCGAGVRGRDRRRQGVRRGGAGPSGRREPQWSFEPYPGPTAEERSMSEPLAGQALNVQDLKRIADEKETAKLQELLTKRRKEEDEEKRARQDFMERELRPDGLERFNNWVRRAAEQGQSEIEIMRFPSQFCTDHGRAINNFEPTWPDTLNGLARRVYDAYAQHLQAQGYKIRAQILNYPDGGLGEVGIYIGW